MSTALILMALGGLAGAVFAWWFPEQPAQPDKDDHDREDDHDDHNFGGPAGNHT